ncbi:hypothetical protein P171DRAFT_508429 [Karstenula rhodostoma CBS 690.94]|uniref:Mid2 domain-containing protein n=1 Tax=Karstenula rhodostoma CBS 690.94 TaxID=1392251 RepID=A0A9P4UGI1_9PLEO|nr:hypothetical protein P171DRAFT_508429 [Karstenula rhodostoma CBS 690.94]
MRPTSTVIQGLVLGLWVGSVSADCYAHDGVLAKNSAAYNEDFEMVSCGNGTNNCCFQGDKCGSNLLCYDNNGNTARQYCATQNWDGCSSLCADFAPRTGTLLVDCGKNMYCCGAVDETCCDDDSEHFFVDPLNGDVKHPSKATGSSATASPTWWTVDSKALLAATSTSSASSASSATSTSESNTESSASTTASTTASSTASSTSTPPPEEDSKGISAGAGAGIGIGAAAGIALVAGLAWFLIKRRRGKNVYEAPVGQQHAGGAYGAAAYPGEAKPVGYYAHDAGQSGQAHGLPPQELDGGAGRAEVHGESTRV